KMPICYSKLYTHSKNNNLNDKIPSCHFQMTRRDSIFGHIQQCKLTFYFNESRSSIRYGSNMFWFSTAYSPINFVNRRIATAPISYSGTTTDVSCGRTIRVKLECS